MSETQHHEHPHGHEHGNTEHAPQVKVTSPLVLNKDFKISFKKQLIKDDLGKEIKRPPLTVSVPIPTWDGFVEDLGSDEKVQALVLDLVEGVILSAVREQVNDEISPVMSQEQLDLSKLTLKYIANLPPSDRRGAGISKETWEAWEADYMSVMLPLRQAADPTDAKAADRVARAAKLFVGKYNTVKTDKKVITFLRGQLAQWATHSENAEEFGDVHRYLDERAGSLLAQDSAAVLENL